jgi:nucleotide-binding universal stress UspA family protein
MTLTLAAIDTSSAARPVLRAAAMMARTLGTEIRAIHVLEQAHGDAVALAEHAGVVIEVVDGDPVERIVEASADAAVRLVVVGARRHHAGRRPAGHVAAAVMTRVHKPVLVVPPNAHVPAAGVFERVLLPLEGTIDSTDAVAGPLRALAGAGAQITVVHVFRPGTLPRFWDHAGHAHQSFGAEFLAHWCEHPLAHLRLRSGDVAGAALDVATREGAQLIVLGWSQDLTGSRARVVNEVLSRSETPVLLAPVAR